MKSHKFLTACLVILLAAANVRADSLLITDGMVFAGDDSPLPARTFSSSMGGLKRLASVWPSMMPTA